MRVGDVILELGTAVELTDDRERPGDHEVHGKTAGRPDVAAVRAQVDAAAFELVTDQFAPANGAFSLVGVRGPAILTINFSGAPWNVVFANLLDQDAMPDLEVSDGGFAWGGVVWPAYFESATLVSDRPDAFLIESQVHDPLATVERYRAWACAQGFDIEGPLNAWEAEPDMALANGLRFRGATFQAQVGVDGDRLTLFLTPFP
jgi:hypothetical protein